VWSYAYGGVGSEVAQDVAVDPKGNLFVTGAFYGETTLADQVFANAFGADIFLLKVDPDGVALSANAFPGDPDSSLLFTSMASQPTGSAILGGTCTGPLQFGDKNPPTNGGFDMVVGEINEVGQPDWVVRYGDSAGQSISGVSTDTFGAIIVAGSVDGTVNFGGGPTLPKGKNDIAVVKLDKGGAFIWNKRFGDIGNDLARAVAIGPDSGIVVAGSFEGTVDFGAGPVTAPGSGPTEVLLKLDPNGNLVWVKLIPTEHVSITAMGDVVLAGTMDATLDLGCGTMTTSGQKDIFVAKLGADGTCQWSKQLGGAKDQTVSSLAAGPDGSVLLTGQLFGTVDFGPGKLVGPMDGDAAAMLVKLDPTGAPVWGRVFSSMGAGAFVAAASMTDVFFAGTIADSADLGGDKLISSGAIDLVVAKFHLP
jgi:hypothetical protein